MMNNASSVTLYSLPSACMRTYVVALLFVIGNLVLPRLVHMIPLGGPTWLPIYFFTLVAAYKYGWRVGLLTAILSPLINHLLFGMPTGIALPVIFVKSTILAVTASVVARRYGSVSLASVGLVVVVYQVLGSIVEWGIVGNLYAALQDIRVGFPGLLVQIAGGWALVKYIR